MSVGFTFDEQSIRGELNCDITPEKIAAIGCAASGIMGEKLAVSTDSDCLMVKNALIAGALSGGATILDFGEQPKVITRSGIMFYNLSGGFHISEGGKRIDLLSSNGLNPDYSDIAEIKRLCKEGKMKRVADDKIREVVSLQSYKMYYLRAILNDCHNEQLGFNLLISVDNSTVKNIVTAILKDTGCRYTLYRNHEDRLGEEFAGVVKNEGYDFGVFIDKSGEQLTLCDGRGRILTKDIYQCLCSMIIFKGEKERTFVAPIDAAFAVDIIAEAYGGKIIRTGRAKKLIMSKVSELGREGMCSQFILEFDPVGSLIKIMDFLKSQRLTLEGAVNSMPSVYIVSKDVECRESKKARIMHRLAYENKGRCDITEGVKIYEKGGWTLISPETKNYFKITAEGASTEMAEEFVNKYIDKIRKIK